MEQRNYVKFVVGQKVVFSCHHLVILDYGTCWKGASLSLLTKDPRKYDIELWLILENTLQCLSYCFWETYSVRRKKDFVLVLILFTF